MPGTRIDQLKKVIAASKTMHYEMGKNDSLASAIKVIEANINNGDDDAIHLLNCECCYEIFKHIMDNQSYLANSNKNGDNNIMIAYALLSALDGKLAKNVREKINNDPKNQVWLNLYNTFCRDTIKEPVRKKYMEEGKKLDDKYQIKQIDRENRNPLGVDDLRNVENIRSIYIFLTKQGKTIFHTNTATYEALCEHMKLLLEYVDTAKDAAERSLVDKALDDIASISNTYVAAKLAESNYEGPKTPRGKARFAAAYALLKMTNPEKASSYTMDERYSAIKDKFGNKLVDAVLKKAAETKIEVDVKPLIEEVKEANHYTEPEAVKRLKRQLESIQIKINDQTGLEKMKLMMEYVVVNEIKNQVITKGDEKVIDNFNVEKNIDKLFDNCEFRDLIFLHSENKELNMETFCKTLPEKLAEVNKDPNIIKTFAESALEKAEVHENKVEDKKVEAPVMNQ